ncbi:unnamed protein product [Camellia sinensis]
MKERFYKSPNSVMNKARTQIRNKQQILSQTHAMAKDLLNHHSQTLGLLVHGAANRKVAATNMNLASSRSHSVFTCIIESKWESQGVTRHLFARLNLVDLAGSERQKSSSAKGERLKEATNIKSLSTIGLADHILEFRSSALQEVSEESEVNPTLRKALDSPLTNMIDPLLSSFKTEKKIIKTPWRMKGPEAAEYTSVEDLCTTKCSFTGLVEADESSFSFGGRASSKNLPNGVNIQKLTIFSYVQEANAPVSCREERMFSSKVGMSNNAASLEVADAPDSSEMQESDSSAATAGLLLLPPLWLMLAGLLLLQCCCETAATRCWSVG